MHKLPRLNPASELNTQVTARGSVYELKDLLDNTYNHDGILAWDHVDLILRGGSSIGQVAEMASRYARYNVQMALENGSKAPTTYLSHEMIARHFQIVARSAALADRAMRAALLGGLVTC